LTQIPGSEPQLTIVKLTCAGGIDRNLERADCAGGHSLYRLTIWASQDGGGIEALGLFHPGLGFADQVVGVLADLIELDRVALVGVLMLGEL
jgi:hypothetical protein